MQRHRVPLLVLVLALAAACPRSTTHPPAPTPAAEPLSYTALGDSIATGFGLRGYVPRYAERFRRDTGQALVVTNLARNGWTAADLLGAVRQRAAFREAVARADVLTFNIVGNDLLAARARFRAGTCGGDSCLREAVARFERDWSALLDELVALRPPHLAVVRTMTVYDPFVAEDSEAGIHATFLPYLERVNSHIERTSAAHGILVADVYRAFNGPGGVVDPGARGLLHEDGLHPSAEGHALIAELLAGLGYAPLR